MIDLGWALQKMVQWHGAIPRTFSRGGSAFTPLHMLMEVTYACNLRCNFCQYLDIIEGSAKPFGPVRGNVDLAVLRQRIDEMPRGRLITFSGGEVLVRKDFPELLRHASRRHRTHVISNGTRIDDAIAELYVELAPRWPWQNGFVLLGTNLEGTEARHDAVVQRPGSWQRTVAGIRNVIARRTAARTRFPVTVVNLVVTADTAAGLVDFMHLGSDLGVDVVTLQAEHDLVGHAAGGRTERLRVPQRTPRGVDPAVLRAELIRCFELERRLGVQLRLTPHVPIDEFVRHYTDDRSLDPSEYVCDATWSRVAISASGDYAPMCHFRRAGDVRRDGLRAVWNGASFRAFRRDLRRDRVYPACSGCCNLRYVGPKPHGLEGVATH